MSGEKLEKRRELPLDRELPKRGMVQPFLDGFLQAEAEFRESSIDYDTWFEHKRRMAMRWFGYYRKCKDGGKMQKISNQYNKIACMMERDR